MSMMFVASIYLLIGLVLGVTIGRLMAETRQGQQSENETAVKIAKILNEGQLVSISTVISKSREEEEEEEEEEEGAKEFWRWN